jgi:hypothetical protein
MLCPTHKISDRLQTWRTFLTNHFGQLTVTSPLMVCDAPDDDDALDVSEVLPRLASVSRESSSVSNQWSIVCWPLSLQCVSVDGLIGQAHVQHRKREHPSSSRDPPKARQSKSDSNVYEAPFVRSLHGAVGASNASAPILGTAAGRLVTLRSITWPASSRPCDVQRVERREAHTWRVILAAAGVLATHRTSPGQDEWNTDSLVAVNPGVISRLLATPRNHRPHVC